MAALLADPCSMHAQAALTQVLRAGQLPVGACHPGPPTLRALPAGGLRAHRSHSPKMWGPSTWPTRCGPWRPMAVTTRSAPPSTLQCHAEGLDGFTQNKGGCACIQLSPRWPVLGFSQLQMHGSPSPPQLCSRSRACCAGRACWMRVAAEVTTRLDMAATTVLFTSQNLVRARPLECRPVPMRQEPSPEAAPAPAPAGRTASFGTWAGPDPAPWCCLHGRAPCCGALCTALRRAALQPEPWTPARWLGSEQWPVCRPTWPGRTPPWRLTCRTGLLTIWQAP